MPLDFGRDLIVRWHDPQPAHVGILKQIGVQGVLLDKPDETFAQACRAARIQAVPQSDLKTVSLAKLPADPGPYAALTDGLWPGISRGATQGRGADDETASASREPWVDSNAYRIAYLRALYPKAAPVLAYEANEKSGLGPDRIVPFETLELALVEARVMGGNYILSLDPRFREPLLKGDPKALAAWKQIGNTVKYLSETERYRRSPPLPAVTCIVEPGRQTHEIVNLLFRRNASPLLTTAETLPAPSRDILALVATGLRTPKPDIAARIMAHAEQGATVVTDDVSPEAWWRAAATNPVKKQMDRVFYSVGKGTLVAYNRRVVDPSEHALDVIDIVTHARRPVRVWNASTVIATASPGILHLLNYSDPGRASRRETQVRVQGHFQTAQLLSPDSAPATLEVKLRGSTTEIFVPAMRQTATVLFGPASSVRSAPAR